MNWARWFVSNRTIGNVALVTLVHAIALSWALSFKISAPATSVPESLIIEFAETATLSPPEPPIVEPPREPAPENRQAPAAPEPDITPPAENTLELDEPASPGPRALAEPEVLTQNARSDEAMTQAVEGDASGGLSQAQVATELNLLDCQKLRDHRGDDCPDKDPFTAAATAAERDTVQPKPWADSDYINKTVMEKFLDREARARFLWPDADLFTDPMPPGAYYSQRIRD